MARIKVSSYEAVNRFPETQGFFYDPFLDEVKSAGYVVAENFKNWTEVKISYKQSSVIINGISHHLEWDRYNF